TGSNQIVARFSGINEKKIKYICYIISGITAAITGLLLAGYTGTASAESGAVYSMNSIVAVVIGGTAISGGKGGYMGTIAGAVIMATIDNILTVINIPESGRIIAQGAIILVMVLVYGRNKRTA
ncbi:MAG: ABC transporter permease, partial [Saccharofermentanales bacterium]